MLHIASCFLSTLSLSLLLSHLDDLYFWTFNSLSFNHAIICIYCSSLGQNYSLFLALSGISQTFLTFSLSCSIASLSDISRTFFLIFTFTSRCHILSTFFKLLLVFSIVRGYVFPFAVFLFQFDCLVIV